MAFQWNLLNGQICSGQSVPIGEMSGMKDHMYDTRKMMNGEMPSEGFKISTKQMRQDPNLLREMRKNSKHLNIVGSRNEKDDQALFELVTRHCIASTKNLRLTRMIINIPAEKLQVFPELREVTFDSCSIENDSILRFNQWCPNVEKLSFEEVKLVLAVYNAYIASEHTFPNVKSLTFSFKNSVKLTRGFLNILSNRFPMVENLEIIMSPYDNVKRSDPKYNVAYQPLHFKNVTKLFVRAFAGEIDKLFDYMAISNEKLKDFSFAGMAITDELANWIKSCKQLDELAIDWQYRAADAGCSINNIKDTQSLTKVTLIVKYLDWRSEDIIRFARENPRLLNLNVECEQQHTKLKFGKQFKKMFADLIKERSKLSIKLLLIDDDREVEISEKGFSDKERSVPSSDGEGPDMATLMAQMVMRFNNRD